MMRKFHGSLVLELQIHHEINSNENHLEKKKLERRQLFLYTNQELLTFRRLFLFIHIILNTVDFSLSTRAKRQCVFRNKKLYIIKIEYR